MVVTTSFIMSVSACHLTCILPLPGSNAVVVVVVVTVGTGSGAGTIFFFDSQKCLYITG